MDPNVFIVKYYFTLNNALFVLRLWVNNNEHLIVSNVYAPCDMEEKRALGHQLYRMFIGD